ncbi:Uncharacterized protein dnm_008650 [Desulfonema magnum]|uniref:Uncharacterized protein n=1 Tax=Desulfonema magnum TaxID=45655 RepID=A0A975BG32_9BACT|nr:Uncharacterized protein dnm_008650 [Desulfonema magnum]
MFFAFFRFLSPDFDKYPDKNFSVSEHLRGFRNLADIMSESIPENLCPVT